MAVVTRLALLAVGVALMILAAAADTPRQEAVDDPAAIIATLTSGDPGPLHQLGFTATNVTAWSAQQELDALSRDGLRGIVWTGAWQRESCRFEMTDRDIRRWLRPIRDHPALYAVQLSDEPRQGPVAGGCPNAVTEHRARRRLIERLVPSAVTLVTLDTSQTEQYRAWREAADVHALVVYPCTIDEGCQSGKIASEVDAARAAGVDELIGVVQTFGNEWAKMPSPKELDHIMNEWIAAGVHRYIYYAYSGHEPQRIDNTPAVRRRVHEWNRRLLDARHDDRDARVTDAR
jgi:hypothetical protein